MSFWAWSGGEESVLSLDVNTEDEVSLDDVA